MKNVCWGLGLGLPFLDVQYPIVPKNIKIGTPTQLNLDWDKVRGNKVAYFWCNNFGNIVIVIWIGSTVPFKKESCKFKDVDISKIENEFVNTYGAWTGTILRHALKINYHWFGDV